jgi:L-amino acid N-acyltransferase YncA
MIRAATPEDAAVVAAIYAPLVRDSIVSFEEDVPDAAEMASRMGSSISWLVHEIDGSVAGYAYAAPFQGRAAYKWSAEVSVYIADAARGRGVGRELIDALLDELRRRGYVNAFAGIALPNDASVRLFETFGFKRIALQETVGYKLGAWHDVGWWQLQLREPSVPPPELD